MYSDNARGEVTTMEVDNVTQRWNREDLLSQAYPRDQNPIEKHWNFYIVVNT